MQQSENNISTTLVERNSAVFKKLTYLFLSLCILLAAVFFLATTSPVTEQQQITPADVSAAKKLLSDTVKHLSQHDGTIALSFDQSQLNALFNVASYASRQMQFRSEISPFGLMISGRGNLYMLFVTRGLDANCLLGPTATGFAIVSCWLGQLPVPGFVANWLLHTLVNNTIAAPADQQLLQLLATGEIRQNRLVFSANNAAPIQLRLQPQFYQPFAADESTPPLAADIAFYLQQLKLLRRKNFREHRLAFYLHQLFTLAEQRATMTAQPINEAYQNAMWAAAVTMGNRKFIYYANPAIQLNQVPKTAPVTLNGRRDLALHFLYSAVIQMLSSSELSEQIGLLKEIMDADSGGSGFSFADLAADKAGTRFAERLNTYTPSCLENYSPLNFEHAIMPPTDELLEGLDEYEFSQLFGQMNSQTFDQVELTLKNLINNLPLQQKVNCNQ